MTTLVAAGCAIARETPQEITVDSTLLGDIVPGTRQMFGWPVAERHCRAFGKTARLHDLKGTAATFRCVDR